MDGQAIEYDDIGNPTSYYDGYRYTFAWEQGRQLKSSTYNNRTTNYRYNEDGLRTEKYWADGSSVKYDIVDGKTVGEIRYGANGVLSLYMRYIFDESGSVVGIGLWYPNSGQWTDYYFVKNLQGDVVEVYDTNNTLAASYTYDAWGNILTQSGHLADINPFRYRSYYFDNETWFYYLQSRYYAPGLGRFINADALTPTGQGLLGNNMFAYCRNNPVNYSDPAGLCALHMTNILDNRFSNITMCGCGGGSGSSYYQESASGGVINDTLEFIFNTDEQAVLDAEYFAFYNGVPVVKLPIGTNAFSFFVIFLGDDVKNRVDPVSTVRHEYGHSRHFRMIGPLNYASTVFLPSVLGFHFGSDEYHSNYYSHGYEYIANVLGDAYNDMIYPESTDKWGLAYFLYTLILPK